MNTWKVITHTDFYYKIVHEINSKEMAKEYVERILTRGDFYKDDRGVTTFIPTARIMKVKLVPPDVEMELTKTRVE